MAWDNTSAGIFENIAAGPAKPHRLWIPFFWSDPSLYVTGRLYPTWHHLHNRTSKQNADRSLSPSTVPMAMIVAPGAEQPTRPSLASKSGSSFRSRSVARPASPLLAAASASVDPSRGCSLGAKRLQEAQPLEAFQLASRPRHLCAVPRSRSPNAALVPTAAMGPGPCPPGRWTL
jgi:hypothetical protein